MPAMGPMQVRCPGCGAWLPVPAKVLSEHPGTHAVTVELDARPLRVHLVECQRQATTEVATTATRPMPAIIAPGERACVGCGASNSKCLTGLQKHHLRKPHACCGMCADGNTHPAPGAAEDCQVWGAEHGPRADA